MGLSASECAELRALAAAARERSFSTRAASRAVRERAGTAREHHREVHREHMKVMEASVQALLARAFRAEHLAADPDAMRDQLLATSVTLMALRPKLGGDLAPLIDDALKRCEDIVANIGDLARTYQKPASLWWDDLREIDGLASAIYEHLAGGGSR